MKNGSYHFRPATNTLMSVVWSTRTMLARRHQHPSRSPASRCYAICLWRKWAPVGMTWAVRVGFTAQPAAGCLAQGHHLTHRACAAAKIIVSSLTPTRTSSSALGWRSSLMETAEGRWYTLSSSAFHSTSTWCLKHAVILIKGLCLINDHKEKSAVTTSDLECFWNV